MNFECTQCRQPFSRKQTTKNAKGHYFCSRSCAAVFNSTGRPSPYKKPRSNCKFCNKECGRRDQIYCSNQCYVDSKKHAKLNDWQSGKDNCIDTNGNVCRPVRRYLLSKAGDKCTICGWNELNPKTGKCPLEIHHKDGDHTNNAESNLQVLCPNCHALTPSYGSINTGRGRRLRSKV